MNQTKRNLSKELSHWIKMLNSKKRVWQVKGLRKYIILNETDLLL